MIIGEINHTVLIGQKGCAACERVRQNLELKGEPYIYIDINDLSKAMSKEIIRCRKSNNVKKIGVPLIIQNGELSMGFEKSTV